MEGINSLDFCDTAIADRIRHLIESEARYGLAALTAGISRSSTVSSLKSLNFNPPSSRSAREICCQDLMGRRGSLASDFSAKKLTWLSVVSLFLALIACLLVYFLIFLPDIQVLDSHASYSTVPRKHWRPSPLLALP